MRAVWEVSVNFRVFMGGLSPGSGCGGRMRAVWEVSVNFRVFMVGLLLVGTGASALGQKPPLLPEKDVAAVANELRGETAKRNLEGIARFHRQRGSKGFHEAAELVAGQLRAYGLSDVEILQFHEILSN